MTVRVQLPEGPVFEAAVVDTERWNGWANPRFSWEVAKEVAAYFASLDDVDDGYTMEVDEESRTILMFAHSYRDEWGEGATEQFICGADGLVAWGWGWCWVEVDEDGQDASPAVLALGDHAGGCTLPADHEGECAGEVVYVMEGVPAALPDELPTERASGVRVERCDLDARWPEVDLYAESRARLVGYLAEHWGVEDDEWFMGRISSIRVVGGRVS